MCTCVQLSTHPPAHQTTKYSGCGTLQVKYASTVFCASEAGGILKTTHAAQAWVRSISATSIVLPSAYTQNSVDVPVVF